MRALLITSLLLIPASQVQAFDYARCEELISAFSNNRRNIKELVDKYKYERCGHYWEAFLKAATNPNKSRQAKDQLIANYKECDSNTWPPDSLASKQVSKANSIKNDYIKLGCQKNISN